MKSFLDYKFGMFIHWGLYSVLGRGEWVRSHEQMPLQDYQPNFDNFDPTGYDPCEWARIAKQAGMTYAVLTTKHHDGFCLFDTKYTDYKAANTKAGRDLVREYADAFRAEDIAVGFYHSLIDWHHPDYPHYGDAHHPERENELFKDTGEFSKYREYLHNQVEELMTNYGKIDLLWFDYSYDDMNGSMWGAEDLVKMIKRKQPNIILNNRLMNHLDDKIGVYSAEPSSFSGDFATPEQYVPETGLLNVLGQKIPWESCMTLNDNWGYHKDDHNWKTAEDVLKMLHDCNTKGGNLLLNVGPDGKGVIPAESIKILQKIGQSIAI